MGKKEKAHIKPSVMHLLYPPQQTHSEYAITQRDTGCDELFITVLRHADYHSR